MPRTAHPASCDSTGITSRSLDDLALRQEGRATSQRCPSLNRDLWSIETIWEHTIILIQIEEWICRQEEVVGAIVVVQELLRSLRVPPKETRLVKRRGCRIRDH